MEDPTADSLPVVLTVDELAKLFRLNRKTVYEAINRGAIAGVRRFGRIIRIDRDGALAWLRAGNDTLSLNKSRFRGGHAGPVARGAPVLPSLPDQRPAQRPVGSTP